MYCAGCCLKHLLKTARFAVKKMELAVKMNYYIFVIINALQCVLHLIGQKDLPLLVLYEHQH